MSLFWAVVESVEDFAMCFASNFLSKNSEDFMTSVGSGRRRLRHLAAVAPPRVLPLRRRRWGPAARGAIPRRRRLGRDDALAIHLMGLPVAALVIPRAVPERLARRALLLRRLRAGREGALHGEVLACRCDSDAIF